MGLWNIFNPNNLFHSCVEITDCIMREVEMYKGTSPVLMTRTD